MPDLATIYVDYNDIDGGEQTTALMEDASEAVSAGETVLSLDEEGNHCVASVVRLDDDVVTLRLDWSTWAPSQETEQGYTIPVASRTAFFGNLGRVVGHPVEPPAAFVALKIRDGNVVIGHMTLSRQADTWVQFSPDPSLIEIS